MTTLPSTEDQEQDEVAPHIVVDAFVSGPDGAFYVHKDLVKVTDAWAEETTDPAQSPRPGSDAAIAAGCLCPVLDNSYGAGVLESGLYIIAEGCPLHVPAQDEVAE